jgi:hypothetical protein
MAFSWHGRSQLGLLGLYILSGGFFGFSLVFVDGPAMFFQGGGEVVGLIVFGNEIQITDICRI